MAKVVLILFCAFSVVNSIDWWEKSTLYQIYPKTFKDSNNDGIGDLNGILSKLGYINEIGIDAIIIQPIFKSPLINDGYDISDFKTIYPVFGTIDDLKYLIKMARGLGIKIILDFVPNHTSDQHEWFTKSVNGDLEYEDFYVWRKGKNNNTKPPCKWESVFGGSAWTFNKKKSLWYYHALGKNQPDLNFRNPKVIEAINDIMIYWLDIGIAGFKLDSVPYLVENEQLNNEPKDENDNINPIYTKDINETYEIMYQWRNLIDKYNKKHADFTRISIVEPQTNVVDNAIRYTVSTDGTKLGAHLALNYDFLRLKNDSTASEINCRMNNWLTSMPQNQTFNWVTGTQDISRVASRVGKENVDAFNMLQAFLPGVMVTYNGEEYGMEDTPVNCDQGRDLQATKNCQTYSEKSRDFQRTPMQWDDTMNAGFNEGSKPWLPLNLNYINNNIKNQIKRGVKSHLNIYKSLKELRYKIASYAATSSEILDETILQITRSVKNKLYLFLYNRLGDRKRVELYGNSTIVAASLNSDKHANMIIGDEIYLDTNECVIIYFQV